MATHHRILTHDELRRVRNGPDPDTPEGLAVSLLLAGCRPSELVRLRRHDVLWDGRRAILQLPVGGKGAGSQWHLPDHLGAPLLRFSLQLAEPDAPLLDLPGHQVSGALAVACQRAGVQEASVTTIRHALAFAARDAAAVGVAPDSRVVGWPCHSRLQALEHHFAAHPRAD